jgi:signal peptidase II
MSLTTNRRIAFAAGGVFMLDQFTKWAVLKYLNYTQEIIIIPGFFKFVHWTNTGAAWSLFSGNNGLLALVAVVALIALLLGRRRFFDTHSMVGSIAFGMVLGGIVGNLFDRILPSRQHVVDFIYFFINRPDGRELGFPAFNVADSTICVGVGLLLLLNWRTERAPAKPAESSQPKSIP